MSINPYSIGPIITGLAVLALAVYVLSKDRRNPLNQAFFNSSFSLVVWLSFYGIIYNLPSFANTYYKIAYCGIVFIPVTFHDFIFSWIKFPWLTNWRITNYVIGLIECGLILKTNLIVNGNYQYFFGTYPKAGTFHPYFLAYFILLLSIQIGALFYYWKKSPNIITKKQAKLLLLAYLIVSFACIDFIPNYGIELYPPGFLCALIFTLTIAYAIFRHNLLGIKTFISNSIVYSILIAIVFLAYSLIILILEKSVQSYLGYKSLGISVIFAFAIGLLIIPLRNFIQSFIDSSFLKGSPVQLSEENALLRQELSNADKLRSVAILASSLAHEIKNPITTINTFADYLPNKQNDAHFFNKCRKTLMDETNRIESLLTQLLNFAKPSSPVFQKIEPHLIFDEILMLIENKCAKKQIRIQRSYRYQSSIQADANQLKQAFLNILLNAIEAMPNNGLITVNTEEQFQKYIITIGDTGPGIASKDLKSIFDPFFTTKEKGTGLGLSITHGIIKEHGGKIFVESKVGQGTTFRIELKATAGRK